MHKQNNQMSILFDKINVTICIVIDVRVSRLHCTLGGGGKLSAGLKCAVRTLSWPR